MRKPGPMEAFDALYILAAGNGRGEALFGKSIELARPAYERTLIGDGRSEERRVGKECRSRWSPYH